MNTQDITLPMPAVGDEDETCAGCGAPLAADQRYCLECGARRAGPGLPYKDVLTRERVSGAAVPPPPPPPARDWTPMVALGGLAALVLVLIVGVLIGTTGFGGDPSAPQVVRVDGSGTGAAGGAAETASVSSFKSDWPSGKEGYTVELGTLPKKGSTAADVAAAKADAGKKGASDIGALDSDDFGSLPGGDYVLYSGVFGKKADAKKALDGLKDKFPDAKVVKVSAEGSKAGATDYVGKDKATLNQKELQDLDNVSGEEYQKRLKKLPKELTLPGKPPKKDNKRPGGGTAAQTIG